MRYIDFQAITLPNDWEQKAQQALEEIKQLPPDQRSKAIVARAELWRDLKPVLKQVSFDKCWYCESVRHRCDDAVDHFRPKGRVAECKNHEGYWWLAFDWHNYRFSCTWCNSRRVDQETGRPGGKQDYFPLLDESTRAATPEADLEAEQPCILDPTKATDPGLLWFQQDGQVVPKYPNNQLFKRRANESIRLYHLDYTETVERRQILYKDVEHLVKRGDRYFAKWAENSDLTAQYALEDVLHELRKRILPNAEFSAAAKAYLLGFRSSSREWLDGILTIF
jgi:uncharacterized protein (TIGR02646 family)